MYKHDMMGGIVLDLFILPYEMVSGKYFVSQSFRIKIEKNRFIG